MNTGIYKIENIINGDLYIGQSKMINIRITTHKHKLKINHHFNIHLQNAWNKYGENIFIFKTILFCEEKELTYYEQKLVNTWKPKYNICTICVNSSLGRKLSDEHKRNISISKKGIKFSDDHKNKLSKAQQGKGGINHPNFGRVFSKEHRMKMSDARKGTKSSEETKRKISNSLHSYWIRRQNEQK